MKKTYEENFKRIEKLGSIFDISFQRWKDDWKHWRAGLDWFSEDGYKFVCEYPTIEECLDAMENYIMSDEELKVKFLNESTEKNKL